MTFIMLTSQLTSRSDAVTGPGCINYCQKEGKGSSVETGVGVGAGELFCEITSSANKI